MGIHKDNNQSKQSSSDSLNKKQISQSNINTKIIWNTSVNSGINGNSGYLYPAVTGDIMYTVDTAGLLSAVSLVDGSILWNVSTDIGITSGLSILNDKICVGTTTAKLLCYEISRLSSNKHIPLISNMSNAISFSKYKADIDIDLVTELASPIQAIDNLYLVKLDNDDLYLLNPESKKIVWKSTSQIISLRSKGSSMPLIREDKVYIARDNGSISSHNVSDGVLNWFTVISSRSGRNDLESQRDAEMSINIENGKIYYGHYQGELNSIDIKTGQIIWSSPFSFTNDLFIKDNSIYGTTTDNMLVSIDQASGFLNWKSQKSDEQLTQPFIIDNIVMAFTTEGTLVGFTTDGTLIYEKKFDLNLHSQTRFIVKKNKLYFQTRDGDIVHLLITI
tara:strand:+ start:5222 stop:6394 length:1173 start_codon:yes stop_codon:yes gene_type:complete